MNELSQETSPYLLQHRNNPVHWKSWSDATWKKAIAEDKLVLVSIGYSACHWCHVMEHEVFEDNECAEWMNKHFICIKVDREERPDVDGIYMDAIHLMGGRGGWPLNVFALPDGRPVYGGTYFPKQQWLSILENLVSVYKHERSKVETYAEQMDQGLKQLHIIENGQNNEEADIRFVDEKVTQWSASWDMKLGGNKRAPKFPMPSNYNFLLRYSITENFPAGIDFVNVTLNQMAMGGIYDQVGGGFCRYSVDELWKVPHFEKMLYDNAQLISLYAQHYSLTNYKNDLSVIQETIEWAENELKTADGLFASALDADSEGIEGKFYTWTKEEMEKILGDESGIALDYYCIGKEALWEHDQNIPLRKEDDETFSEKHQIDYDSFLSKKKSWNRKLLEVRNRRIAPGLDDKVLTSWNAMMISAYVDAHFAAEKSEYLNRAILLYDQLKKCMFKNGRLYRVFTKGKLDITAFLEDYASIITAALDLFGATGKSGFLDDAKSMTEFVITHYHDRSSGLFYFTGDDQQKLVSRKMETEDNVIPASNSVMARALNRLYIFSGEKKYGDLSSEMLRSLKPQMSHASAYSNWFCLFLDLKAHSHEVVAVGPNAFDRMAEIRQHYLPHCVFAASTVESELHLFHNRFHNDTAIYVCNHGTCHAPVFTVAEALNLLEDF